MLAASSSTEDLQGRRTSTFGGQNWHPIFTVFFFVFTFQPFILDLQKLPDAQDCLSSRLAQPPAAGDGEQVNKPNMAVSRDSPITVCNTVCTSWIYYYISIYILWIWILYRIRTIHLFFQREARMKWSPPMAVCPRPGRCHRKTTGSPGRTAGRLSQLLGNSGSLLCFQWPEMIRDLSWIVVQPQGWLFWCKYCHLQIDTQMGMDL